LLLRQDVWQALLSSSKIVEAAAPHFTVSPGGIFCERVPRMKEFDFLVLGGGSAGYAAARTAAGLGLKTAVIEKPGELGGLCILRGCMPSKAMIESANRFLTLKRASEFGLHAGDISADPKAIQARKQRLIREFAEYRADQLKQGKFTLFRGTAKFTDANTVNLTDGSGETIRFRTAVIATGSEINHPAIPGLNLPGLWDSDQLLSSDTLPESMLLFGAGPVGLEAAHYLNALGCRVTVIQRSPQILTGSDAEAAGLLAQALSARGIEIHTGSELESVEQKENGLWTAHWKEDGNMRSATAAAAFNALGRKPALGGLDPAQAGVEIREGLIATGTNQQTSCRHIFAAGDVCGPLEVVHIAIQQGEIAARNAARELGFVKSPEEHIDYRLKLFATFTQPQLASVGMTGREAEEKGIPVREASHPFEDHGKSMVRGETEGIVKLTAHADSGEILGATVVGPEAAELIHEIVVAMAFRSTARQLAVIPHYHPTLSEIWTYPAEELAEATGGNQI